MSATRSEYLRNIHSYVKNITLLHQISATPEKNKVMRISRGSGHLFRIKDSSERIVISRGKMRLSHGEGIKHLHPWGLTYSIFHT